jgi:UDP-3-O-[3-hydroxymyristoyl] glucosamine N-acyltransferase
MKIFKTKIDVTTIRQIVQGEYIGDNSRQYDNVTELKEANETSICFYENERYLSDFKVSKAGLIFILNNIDYVPKNGQSYLLHEKPYFAFMSLVSWWQSIEDKNIPKTISPLASIHPTAVLGTGVHIEPFAVISENVIVGDDTYIGSHTVILRGAMVGKSSKVYPHVTIYENCRVGDKCIIHSGAVIGADGFGFTVVNGNQVKIPQVGDVIIEDDVEIGANTCVDRSTIGTTLIQKNSKIDNLVQVGHNCKIEEHSILCSQVGLAGGTHIGKNVYLAGQVGVGGHLKIDDNTLVGGQSGVTHSLSAGQYFGTPALPAFEQKKIMTSLKELPSIVRIVKKLK